MFLFKCLILPQTQIFYIWTFKFVKKPTHAETKSQLKLQIKNAKIVFLTFNDSLYIPCINTGPNIV